MSASFQPMYFGPSDQQHLGLLHLPAGSSRPRMGVVICNPFGYEEICAHRTLRELAESLAGLGIAALRFDYAGCGDSAGEGEQPGQVSLWLRSIRLAVDAMRAQIGDAPLALAGVRLGATLAALADVRDIQALLTLAPVIRPRAYLRELRAMQATSGGPAIAPRAGVLEAGGFELSAETQAVLSSMDLAAATRPVAGHVLILDRDDLPASDAWAVRLRQQGCRVDQQRIAGYARWMTNPHQALVPREALRHAVNWLQQLPLDCASVSGPPPRPASSAVPTSQPWPQDGRMIRESAVHLDRESRLFAVMTEPAVAQPLEGRRALLLLNAGATHRIGPGRMATEVARRAAAQGFLAMRMDVAGIGDSAAARGEQENIVYSRTAVDDVRQAVEALRSRFQATQVILIGLCSGAYHALKAAAAQVPVEMIVMLNPLTFRWEEGMTLDDDLSPHQVVRDVSRYRRNFFQPAAWGRMLRGRVAVGAAVRNVTVHAAARIRAVASGGMRHLGAHGRVWSLAAELEGISRRGVRMRFIFSRGEPGIELLRLQAGRTVRRLGASGALRIDYVDGADHTFTTRGPRERMFEILFAHLGALPR